MAKEGNPNSVSDAGVGALALRSAIMGAGLNVQINASGLKEKTFVEKVLKEAKELIQKANEREAAILAIVREKIG
jgi:glutamate formiminotransferase/formiminotetrahydrofolate cyclodeaminase